LFEVSERSEGNEIKDGVIGVRVVGIGSVEECKREEEDYGEERDCVLFCTPFS
jgi:hypothetical protein